MTKQSKIFIVIPVFNKIQLTKKCLKSLSSQKYKPFEVIVVDANSTDNTVSYIKRYYPQYKIIEGKSLWWWTKSMYIGVKEALLKAKNNDFILTMNNDCYSENNYLTSMIKCAKKEMNTIIGSLVVDAENKKKVLDAGVKINWKEASIYNYTKLLSKKLTAYKNIDVIKNLDTLPGKGTLIPVSIFKKIGNFNYKRLPHYIGDYEFFCRAKRESFKLAVSTKSVLYNFKKQTGNSHVPKHKTSYKEAFNILFGRKSKLNVLDHINFLFLCCPKKYLLINLKQTYKKLLNYTLMVFPFYYIKIFMHLYHKAINTMRILKHNIPIYFKQFNKMRILKHNIPIYFKQFNKMRILKHNIPIYFKQNKSINTVKLFFTNTPFFIKKNINNVYSFKNYAPVNLPKTVSKLIKIFFFNNLLKRRFNLKDWANNHYYQYPNDNVVFNLKRNAVSDAVNITKLIEKVVNINDICIDVGACIGATSIPMWKKVGIGGKVYSIEADPDNIKRIKENLTLNGFPDKFVYNYAIYNSNKKVYLNVFENINGWQSLGNPYLDSTITKDKYKIRKRKVMAETLDTFCNKQKINKIDFLKIDVEGAEIDVFRGASNLLSQKLIKFIVFEISPQMLSWHKRKSEEVIKTIKSFDYHLFKINANGTLTKFKNSNYNKTTMADYLAVYDLKFINKQ